MSHRLTRLGLAAGFALAAAPALAHTGPGAHDGLAAGLAHPFGGPDHVLAMVAVGLLAAQLGGRAMLLLPASFLALMAAGGLLAAAGLALPWAELAIGCSVVALGAMIVAGGRLPAAAAMAAVGAFALFHGQAHGAEMPQAASPLAYGAGFLAATAALHGIGLAAGLAGREARGAALRWAGGAIAAAGVCLILL